LASAQHYLNDLVTNGLVEHRLPLNRVRDSGRVGTYTVQVSADTAPGGQVTVRVGWEFPNVYGSLMPLFGGAN
jgi:hypothetical protein